MSLFRRVKYAAVAAVVSGGGWVVYGQTAATPTNDAPNPFQTIEGHFKLPEGRTWGSTSAVDIARDGRSIWVAERCGTNSCVAEPTTGKMSPANPVLLFDESGQAGRSFGAGMMIFPHGIHVDRDGNVWVTDGQDNAPQAARGAGGGAAAGWRRSRWRGSGRRCRRRRRRRGRWRRQRWRSAGGGRGPAPTAPPPERPSDIRCSSSVPKARCS